MIIPINGVGDVGLVLDREPHELPVNAWSAGENVRFKDGYVEKFKGHAQMAAASVAPYFLLPVQSGATYFWVYPGLAAVYVWDGTTHTDITNAGGAYSATADLNWTGGVIAGIPVLNNAVDHPQMWATVSAGTKLTDLTYVAGSSTWADVNYLCGSLRAFKNFGIALDVTKSGTRYGNLVKWSHPAVPGAVPASWDETDATKDAGEYAIGEDGDFCVDSARLRDTHVIYKEFSCWGMQYIGGAEVFRFFPIFNQIGTPTRRCAVQIRYARHVVFTGDDYVVHDGTNAQSVLDRRMRKLLASTIDPSYYSRSFVAHNPVNYEAWLCFPVTGNAFPSRAIVWNYKDNVLGIRDLENVAHLEFGISQLTGDTWDSDSSTWDSDSSVWDARTYNPAQRQFVSANPADSSLDNFGTTNQFGGTSFTSYVERTGLAIPLKVGAPPDMSTKKFCRKLWPRIEGTTGGVVTVEVGSQEYVGGPVSWKPARNYTIGTTRSVDVRCTGRLLAARFKSTSDIDWRLHGYEMDVVPAGRA